MFFVGGGGGVGGGALNLIVSLVIMSVRVFSVYAALSRAPRTTLSILVLVLLLHGARAHLTLGLMR